MEKAIRILLAEDRDRADELVGLLRRNYAVYVASDDVGLLERADQARKEGRPYDLALIAHEPPVLGGAQTLQRLRVLAPTTILVSLVPEAGAGAAGASGLATAPRDDAQGTVRHVQRLLAERLAALERARTEILEPLANLGESLLRQPNLELALRQLYQALDTLIPADYRYVALRDRQRDRLVFPLYYDHGEYRPTYRRAFQPGHGLAEWVITHDTPLVSGEFPAEAQRRGWPPGDPDSASLPQSIMVLPLHLGGHVIGAVACGSSRPSAFNDTAVTLFTFVADLLAGLVASWWTDLQWQRQSDLLAQLDQALAEAADPAAIYATAADAARKLTAMESATVIRHTPAASAPAQYPVPDDGLAAQFGDVLADLSRQLAQPTHGGGAVDYGPASTLLAGLGARGAGRVVSHALTSGGRVDAMLWLLHPTERPFDAHDKAALEAVARRTTQALSLTQTAAARQREQDAFARIAWRAAQEPQLALLLSSALNEIAKIVPWAGAAVWQGDTMLGVVHRVWQEGRQAAIPDQAVPLDSPLGVAATERQWVVVLPARDAGSGDEAAPSGPGIALSLRAYSTAQAPGLLVLERNPGEAPFTEEETTVLLRLGQVVAAGLEKLRWAGLAMLHRRLSAALVAPEGLWDQVGAALSSALPPGGVAVLSRDGAQWRPLTSMLGPGAGGPIAWTGPAAGLLHALRDGGPCTIYERRVLEAHGLSGIGSLALASIDAGGTSVGAIAFWSARARAAGSPECDLLRHGAEHLAPALWTARQSAGNVHDRQLFDLLQTVQEEAANAYDTDTLLRHMLLQTLSSTPANVGAVLLRESGDRLVVRATHPASAGGTLPQEAYSAALAALRVGEAQYLSTAAGTLACLPLDDASPDGPPRAPLGVLLVGNPHPNAFGARDRDLFAYLATQATALIRRQQVADAERALRSVAGLSVPRAQVLERVPVLIGQALNATVCLVHVLDRRQDRYVLAGLAGLNASEPALQHLDLAGADPGLTALFSASLDQLAAPDGPGARLWAPAVLAGAGLRYSLAVPFRVDGRPFGILSLHSFDGRPPSVGAPRALAALAADLGVVLEGLRQQEQLETLTTLGADLVSASDPQYASVMPAPAGATATALTRLLASAADLVAARAAYLLLRSEETPGLRVHAVSGAATLAPGALLPPTAGTLLAITTPRYLADVPTPRPPGHMTFDVATRSSAILPLMSGSTAGSAVLGVLVVESPTPQAISEEDYRVLQAVAALAAGLLIQHGLVQQLRTQPVQVQRILDTLAPVLGESDRPQAYLDLVAHARETLGADLVVLHPWDGEGPFQVVPPQSGNQQAGALAGSPAMQTLARQVLHDPAGRAAGPLFVGDMRAFQGSELPEWMAAEGVQALSIAPLVSGDAIFGVLFVAYRQPHLFGQSEKEAVRLFASVATLVLKDAGLAMGTRSLGDAQPNAQSDAVAAQMQSLSMAAHELREPVDKVHMIIETALNGLWLPMSDTLRDRLSVAYKLLDDHYDALGRILQLGRLQTGHQDLTREPVVLADLVQAVIGRHAELARTQDVRLEAALDPLLTLQRPQLDVVLMEVVLSNLVHNALKFSPGGSKVTLLCTSTYVERQRRLVYTVTDEGPGIPADQVDRIFEPYFQADNSLGRTGGGMGLGLTLARLVVELHGGSLSVESIPGRGSRFMVQLPFLTA